MNLQERFSFHSFIFGGLFLLGCLLWGISTHSHADSSKVYFIQLDDQTINPVTGEYILKALEKAEKENARALILKLDTPGGLLSSTRSIVKGMLQAKVPIVVYVSPDGARAGSAGVFITYASHVAAMAPSTNIGAAHPVTMGGGSPQPSTNKHWKEIKELLEGLKEKEADNDASLDGSKSDAPKEASDLEEKLIPDEDAMGSKVLQDTVAFIKAIAFERNRNIEWAIDSVANSASITAEEALTKKVIDIIAKSDTDLLKQLHGRTVLINEEEVVLDTMGVTMEYVPMSQKEIFFNILADPNIAYFLMILGFYGLLFEVTHPGFGVPGILGGVFLILAFYSMQTLPTNYAGVALIGLGLILFVAEVFTPTMGLLSIGGLVSLILGSMLLFDSIDPIMRVSKMMILTAAGTTGGITFFLLAYLVRNQRRKVIGGKEGLIGSVGKVQRVTGVGNQAKVFIHGEVWSARAEEPLNFDDSVIVEGLEGMVLVVKKKESKKLGKES